jgi:hypothetical protein
MTRPLSWRTRRPLAAAMLAALCLLALAAPAPASPAARVTDASYLAEGPGDLALALVIRDGRLAAYACDGTSRRAYFTARARRGRQGLRNRDGARLRLRLGARPARATLALPGAAPLQLTARRTAAVAILTVTIRPDGVVAGTAAGGGALGAHLSPAGLFGAIARPGRAPRTLLAPVFATATLHLDGTAAAYPPDRAAAALRGQWRWLVTGDRLRGATTGFIDPLGDLVVPRPGGASSTSTSTARAASSRARSTSRSRPASSKVRSRSEPLLRQPARRGGRPSTSGNAHSRTCPNDRDTLLLVAVQRVCPVGAPAHSQRTSSRNAR